MTDLTSTLTAAGVKICLALGVLSPTYDNCYLVLMKSLPTASPISPTNGPAYLTSSPDSRKIDEKGYSCTPFATYKIYDGSNGTDFLCTREMKIRWIPGTSLWMWVPVDAAP